MDRWIDGWPDRWIHREVRWMARLPDPASCRSNDPLQMVQTLQRGWVQGRWVTSMPNEQPGWAEGGGRYWRLWAGSRAPPRPLFGSRAAMARGQAEGCTTDHRLYQGKRKGFLRATGPCETKPGHVYPSGSASLESGAVEATLLVGDVVGVRGVAGVHVRRVAHLRGACHSTILLLPLVSIAHEEHARWPQ